MILRGWRSRLALAFLAAAALTACAPAADARVDGGDDAARPAFDAAHVDGSREPDATVVVGADGAVPRDAAPGDARTGVDAGAPDAGRPTPVLDDRIVLCGNRGVIVLRESRVASGEAGAVFRWSAAGRTDLPVAVRDRLANLDECRPFAGSLLGVSSDAGGVAIIEYPSGRVVFHAVVPNAHTVELLPGDLVAVAAANDHATVAIFARDRPGSMPLSELDFPAAHGLVWDDTRSLLWVAGHDQLRSYSVQTDRSLRLQRAYTLPERGAHDLRLVPGTDTLVVATNQHVWLVSRSTGVASAMPVLADEGLVKGIDIHPTTGRIVYVQADRGSYWAPRFLFATPAGEVPMPSDRLYKTRWAAGLLAAER